MRLRLDRLDAVLFDLDDTLVDWRGANAAALEAVVRRHMEPAGVTEAAALAAWQEVLEENLAAFRANGRWWTPRDRFACLVALLGCGGVVDPAVCADAYLAAARECLVPLDGAAELVEGLRGVGLRVGLLTNGLAEVQRPKVDALAFRDRFHHVAISGETGLWKPGEDAFRSALSGLGCAPSRAAMVGDSLHFDIEPARRLGMHTVWVHGGGDGGSADAGVAGPRALLGALGLEGGPCAQSS